MSPRQPKRSGIAVKKKILTLLKSGPQSYAQLQRRVNTNDRTIRRYCEELKLFGAVTLEHHEKHKKTGRPYTQVKITKEGLRILKGL